MRDDNFYMGRAIELAKLGWGKTLPNPMVGAVLVKNGKIIGEGAHLHDGGAHAEIQCLKSVPEFLKCPESDAALAIEGSTLYVSLEPCSTHGRTGACTDAIIAAKIANVKIATTDPNPAHSGRGIEILRSRGITCEVGILGELSKKLNFIFNYSISNSKALVALKCALSSDGKIALKKGVKTAITGEDARADLMKRRLLFPAICVGAATVAADNPSLTARFDGRPDSCGVRLILDSHLSLADYHKARNLKSFKVFSDGFAAQTYVVCGSDADMHRADMLSNMGINVMKLGVSRSDETLFWNELKRVLFEDMRIAGVLVEGGAGVYKSLCDARAADYAFEYRSRQPLGSDALSAFEGGANFEIGLVDEKITFSNGDTLVCGCTEFA